ncbi:MAG: phage holin family protein [Sphingobacteriaceae bacterium]|nr:phage holin family protein [Sphingobacteriaceae bacterium]
MPETQTHTQQEEKKASPDLVALLKEYIATKVELTRLTVIERLTVVTANLITDSFVLIMGILTFLFASFTLALYLGEEFGSYALGFGIVALLYLTLALVMYFIKDKLVEKYLHNFMVKRIFNKKK